MASAVARLSAKPVNKCHKLMAKPEWVRIRRWWFGYLDSMQPLDPTEAVTVAMTDRAEHRFLKLRNRILKHDNDQDLLKLEGATGELKTILSFCSKHICYILLRTGNFSKMSSFELLFTMCLLFYF